MDIVKLQIQKKRKELLFLFSKVYSGGLRGIDGYVVQVRQMSVTACLVFIWLVPWPPR